MIVGERKPLEEIQEMIRGYKKVLNVGCGGCTSICLAGGVVPAVIADAPANSSAIAATDTITTTIAATATTFVIITDTLIISLDQMTQELPDLHL